MNSVLQSCQMDIGIRFWNKRTGLVESRYYGSKFLHRPNASELLKIILEATSDLKLDKLIQLAMDGPTVNWKVLEALDVYLEEKDVSKTINIGSCSQHVVHRALKTGTSNTEWGIDKILKFMFWILCDTPARRDDYLSESGTDVLPLSFCPTRWVGDEPVAERALMIWSNMVGVIKYWQSLVKSKRPANKSFETLVNISTDPLVSVKLHFFLHISLAYSSHILSCF